MATKLNRAVATRYDKLTVHYEATVLVAASRVITYVFPMSGSP
ncbi:hypothetical protein [Streptomyces sp. R44]|uniref:Transposase n=1 Tax=Streptomyces sp. R44 TaxID=3238633 RepID=A0AB39SQM0_9ACTN